MVHKHIPSGMLVLFFRWQAGGAVGKEQKFGGRGQRFWMAYPLVNIQKAIENGHLWLIYLLKMVIFHSYVSLPKGRFHKFDDGTGNTLW